MATQKEKVLNHLAKGQSLTANQAWKKYGIANVYEVIRRLRMEGHAIYTNGKPGKQSYRLGTPSKAAVRCQYFMLGAASFVSR